MQGQPGTFERFRDLAVGRQSVGVKASASDANADRATKVLTAGAL
jgi:hypothetical protein